MGSARHAVRRQWGEVGVAPRIGNNQVPDHDEDLDDEPARLAAGLVAAPGLTVDPAEAERFVKRLVYVRLVGSVVSFLARKSNTPIGSS